MMISYKWLCALSVIAILSGCSAGDATKSAKSESSEFPMNPDDARKLRHGKLTGDGITLFGRGEGDNEQNGGASPIGVNSFLWRATLDTLSFMPIASADPFGGVILTDWYEDPNTRGERFKITAMILDRNLRTDAIKVTVFKQTQNEKAMWQDEPISRDMARKLEDTILTQAREMRVRQGG